MRANHPEPGSAAQTTQPHPSRTAPACSECAWLLATPTAQLCRHPHTPVSPVDGLSVLQAKVHRRARLNPTAMELLGMTAWCGPAGALFALRDRVLDVAQPVLNGTQPAVQQFVGELGGAGLNVGHDQARVGRNGPVPEGLLNRPLGDGEPLVNNTSH